MVSKASIAIFLSTTTAMGVGILPSAHNRYTLRHGFGHNQPNGALHTTLSVPTISTSQSESTSPTHSSPLPCIVTWQPSDSAVVISCNMHTTPTAQPSVIISERDQKAESTTAQQQPPVPEQTPAPYKFVHISAFIDVKFVEAPDENSSEAIESAI